MAIEHRQTAGENKSQKGRRTVAGSPKVKRRSLDQRKRARAALVSTLLELRSLAIQDGMKLLDEDGIEAEVSNRRGE